MRDQLTRSARRVPAYSSNSNNRQSSAPLNSGVRLDGLKPMPLGSSRSAVMKQARQPAMVRLSHAPTAGYQAFSSTSSFSRSP